MERQKHGKFMSRSRPCDDGTKDDGAFTSMFNTLMKISEEREWIVLHSNQPEALPCTYTRAGFEYGPGLV